MSAPSVGPTKRARPAAIEMTVDVVIDDDDGVEAAPAGRLMRRPTEVADADGRDLVFLGGTCAGSRWREALYADLDAKGWTYVDPNLPDGTAWTPEVVAAERRAKARAALQIFAVTGESRALASAMESIDLASRRAPALFLIEDAVANPGREISSEEAEELTRDRGLLRTMLETEGYRVFETMAALRAGIAALRAPGDARPAEAPLGRHADAGFPVAHVPSVAGFLDGALSELGRIERSLGALPPRRGERREDVCRMLGYAAEAIEVRARELRAAADRARKLGS